MTLLGIVEPFLAIVGLVAIVVSAWSLVALRRPRDPQEAEWDQVLDRWDAMAPDQRAAFLGEPLLGAGTPVAEEVALPSGDARVTELLG